jgi:serine/threonine protein phosphatase PrpC
MTELNINSIGSTDIGMLRSVNQDAFLTDDSRHLYVVADGMGGHAGGEIASQICIESIQSYLKEKLTDNDLRLGHPNMEVRTILAGAVNYASSKIYERALEEPMLKGMGTTATLLKLIDSYAYTAHVGDSRLYLFRAGFLYQMTSDHSLVSEQIRAGLLTEEEAAFHQLRNVITRSVGYQEEEEVDTSAFAVLNGDLLLICSDGLYSKISDQEIAGILKEYGLKSAPRLIALANERGGDDNISVVLVETKASVLPNRNT